MEQKTHISGNIKKVAVMTYREAYREAWNGTSEHYKNDYR